MAEPTEFRRLRERVAAWGDAGAVFRNSGWLVGDNLARMVLTLAVSVALARSLGAEQLGELKYSLALVALCGAFTNLGLFGTMGTTAVLYVVGSVVSASVIVGVGWWRHGDELSKLLLILIGAIGVLFHAPRVYELWFQYRARSRVGVVARGLPSVLSGLGVLVAWQLGATAPVFAILLVADTILGAIAITLVGARWGEVPRKLEFNASLAREMLAESWPLILSKVATMLYLKIDQVMLQAMKDDAAVGVYSVAVEVSEIWYIIPSALATSALAGIVTVYNTDRAAYRERIGDMLDIMALMAFAIVGLVVPIAGFFVGTFYGPEYVDAAAILRVHIFACPFIFMGHVLSKTIIVEGYLKFSIVRHVAGAVVNIALNLVLIPRWGGYGAAWATVVGYAVASYLACALHPVARNLFVPMTLSLLAPLRLLRRAPHG